MSNFDREFKNQYQGFLRNNSDLNIIVADGLAYKIDTLLEQNITLGKNVLFALLRNGGGTKSNVPGVDLTTVTYYLSYVCYQEHLEDTLSTIYSVSAEKNATQLLVNIDGNLTKYRAIFGVPQIERAIDKRVFNDIDKLVIINQTIQVSYGANAWIFGASYKLTIGNTQYDINGIIRAETAFTPIYDTYQNKGAFRQSEEMQANVSGFVFTLMLIDNDELQTKLKNYLYGITEYNGESLVLTRVTATEEKTVPIKTFSYSTTVENNVGSATLSLKY